MKKDLEWLKEEASTVLREVFNNHALDYVKYIEVKRQLERLFDQLDEPEVLSQEWINENEVFIFDLDVDCEIRYVPSVKLRHLLVPKQEEPTQEQVQKYLSEHGIEIVEKEPETVDEVVADFGRSLERLRELWRNMGVEEVEE